MNARYTSGQLTYLDSVHNGIWVKILSITFQSPLVNNSCSSSSRQKIFAQFQTFLTVEQTTEDSILKG